MQSRARLHGSLGHVETRRRRQMNRFATQHSLSFPPLIPLPLKMSMMDLPSNASDNVVISRDGNANIFAMHGLNITLTNFNLTLTFLSLDNASSIPALSFRT